MLCVTSLQWGGGWAECRALWLHRCRQQEVGGLPIEVSGVDVPVRVGTAHQDIWLGPK